MLRDTPTVPGAVDRIEMAWLNPLATGSQDARACRLNLTLQGEPSDDERT